MRERTLTCLAVALTTAALGCRSGARTATADPSASGAGARIDGRDGRDASAPPSLDGGAGPSALDAASPSAADVAPGEPGDAAIAWGDYFSIAPRRDDAWNALQATYEALPAAAPSPMGADTVVLCRFAVVEPAPRPKSAWDRANGRDLALEAVVDGSPVDRREGPLGQPWLVARVDQQLRGAPAGAAIAFRLRDRDQDHAYPYVNSIELGSVAVVRDGRAPAPAKAGAVSMECRAAPLDVAAEALLPAADRALAAAEAKTAWPAGAPPAVDAVRWELAGAADAIRVGEHLAGGHALLLGRWREREERLRRIVRRHDAAVREAHATIAATPVGAWVAVGKSLSARIGGTACPPVPKGADPGPLNDEQREGCGVLLELRSSAPLRFEANPWGPAYACRSTGDIRVEIVAGPGRANGLCVLGVRRGATWLKGTVSLSPTETTVLVLGGATAGLPLRVQLGEASGVLATPTSAP